MVGPHIERLPFRGGEDNRTGQVGVGSIDIGQPVEPPGDHAHQGKVVLQAFGRFQATILHRTTGFKNFVIKLDLPATAIPADHAEGVLKILDRGIGQE
jgi:hypothetical protein